MPERNMSRAMPASTPKSASFSVIGRGWCLAVKRLIVRPRQPPAVTQSSARRFRGRRVVLFIYAVVVAIAAGTGYLLGTIHPKGLDPELLGLIQLPPTPLGVALYGALTMAIVLGALLLAVNYVSRRYDDARTASD